MTLEVPAEDLEQGPAFKVGALAHHCSLRLSSSFSTVAIILISLRGLFSGSLSSELSGECRICLAYISLPLIGETVAGNQCSVILPPIHLFAMSRPSFSISRSISLQNYKRSMRGRETEDLLCYFNPHVYCICILVWSRTHSFSLRLYSQKNPVRIG